MAANTCRDACRPKEKAGFPRPILLILLAKCCLGGADHQPVIAVPLPVVFIRKPEEIDTIIEVLSLNALPNDIRALVDERETARKEKLWLRADELRVTLKMRGFAVEDSAEGPKVTRV